MIGAELAVGYVFAWAVRKVRRVAGAADEAVDQALDAGVARVHELVAERLRGERALVRVEEEAAAGATQLSEPSRQFLQLAIEDALRRDAVFACALQDAVAAAQTAQAANVRAEGTGIAVGGNVSITAENGGVAAFQMGNVTLGNPPVPGPSTPR